MERMAGKEMETILSSSKYFMAKIAIVTLYRSGNYGSALQSYALQICIKTLGYQCENLRCRRTLINRICIKNLVFAIKNPSIGFQFLKQLLGMKLCVRDDKTENFFDYIDESSHVYRSIEELKTANNKYDAFVCGSNQIWAPNVFNEILYLSFVDNKYRKIAYAPSIGLPAIPSGLRLRMASLIRDIKYLSIREAQGAAIIKDLTGIDVPVVLDPTLLLHKKEWTTIAIQPNIKDDYVLCYFLGKNPRHREIVDKYIQRTGYKLVVLPFVSYDYTWGDMNLKDSGPREFIGLINNARTIFTDSFHGTAFSINLNKQFYAFLRFKENDALCQNSRIINILEMFHLSRRLINDDVLSIQDDSEIKYESVNRILDMKRKQSIDYLQLSLRKSIHWSSKKWLNVGMVSKSKCTGCGACANICPQGCIHLEHDKEGFLFPVIDYDSCINCGQCTKVCPALLSQNKKSDAGAAQAYSAWSKSPKILQSSTSGGIFPFLAKEILNKKGIVIGAALNNDLCLSHIVIEKEEDIGLLQGAKYIQSNTNKVYSNVWQRLKEGRCVLFSGLPCQIAGLNLYLQQKMVCREKLFTCQLVCFGVPSNAIFQEYIRSLEARYKSKVKSYLFRVKSLGWKNYGVKAIFNNQQQYHVTGTKDPFIRGFLKALYLRRCCFQCMHKGFPIRADIAIGDFWNIDTYDKSLAGINGISLVITQTDKGKELFHSIKDHIVYKQQDVDIAIRCNPSVVTCPKQLARRESFFRDYFAKGYEHCIKKYMYLPSWCIGMLKSAKRIYKKYVPIKR